MAAFVDSSLAALFSPQVALAVVGLLIALTALVIRAATATLDSPAPRH